jgi:glycosyltransferase involved in cell wall biosynthesis
MVMQTDAPLVSVFMITYNHENYICEVLKGILMQKTNFDFDIVIGEDCSTDNTRKIILEFAENYPSKFKLLLHEHNIGAMANQIATLQACTGKYIALCEGDDYWTDPYKLQKQVDFLEANPDFSICFHKVKIWKEKENILVDDFITSDVPEITDIYDLAKGNYMHTPSVVFRKNETVLSDFAKKTSIIGDYLLHMLNAKYGKIKRIAEYMAVYRYGVGIWTSPNSTDKTFAHLSLLNAFIGEFDEKLDLEFKKQFEEELEFIFSQDNFNRNKSKIYKFFSTTKFNYTDLLIKDLFEVRTYRLERKSIKKLIKRVLTLIYSRL